MKDLVLNLQKFYRERYFNIINNKAGQEGMTMDGKICIDGKYLVSGETRLIAIYDKNRNASLGNYAMNGGEITYVSGLLVNNSGYINITYQNITNGSPPVNNSFLHDGDCISP